MIQQTVFVGIDVSKARLDVCIHPLEQTWSGGNDPSGIGAVIARLGALGGAVVGIEASGGYERAAADALHAAGIRVHIVSPARVRGFARSLGQLAKTDAIDAAMIARYLATAHQRLDPHQPDPTRTSLSALSAHRRRLVAERSGLISQTQTIDEPLVRQMIQARLQAIAGDIARLDAAMAELLAQTPDLHQRHRRLRQITGVGPVFATALVADMPELGKISPKAAAALLGVAPHARQSGATTRPGRCSGGRKHLRDIAYMAVLSAIKVDDPVLASFYKRLRAKGKPFKLAMVATIRKLITIINAIARTDTAFQT